jgi:pantoate--beta-alanine ligase
VNTVRTASEVRRTLAPLRRTSRIGLVPTMGAFHDGHIALFRAARQSSDHVVVSSFVNPAQFGDPADLAAYPRDEARDARIAAEEGIDLLFVPDVAELYPPGYATWIEVGGQALGLEGDFRPGHFRGVATVCLKLFTIVRPDVACFGQKDAQQVAVVTQLVRDLNLELQIQVVPTVRDSDGLALSSRNVRLSPDERARALAIPRALAAGLAASREGRDPVAAARALLTALEPDYVAVADLNGRPTLAVAARVGGTRLIDNVVLDITSASPGPGIAERGQSAKESGNEQPTAAHRT